MFAKHLPSSVAFCLVLASVLAPAQAIAQPEAGSFTLAGPAAALQALRGRLPLLFVENHGQTDPQVAFTLQAGATTIYFTATGVTYALVEPQPVGDRLTPDRRSPSGHDDAPPGPELRRRWAVKLDFVDANADVRPVGQGRAETVVSYFRGGPGQWHAGLPAFQRIVYPDLWPGIDLAYYGAGGALKYEFVVHPGADPGQIRLAYRGAEGVAFNAAGQLAVSTPVGGFTDDVPVAWQDGPGGRVPVAAAYDSQIIIDLTEAQWPDSAATARGFGFRVDAYDPTRTLVLDPIVLFYSGYIGGAGQDEGSAIAVDAAGNAYVTGRTSSDQATFPAVAGPDLIYNGNEDAFVAKINPTGTALLYAGFIGGAGQDWGNAIAVDSNGNAYIAGSTSSNQASFPVVGGPDLTFNGGETDAFVAMINPAGTALLYAGYIGGSAWDYPAAIAVDGAGNAYVTGQTLSDEATFPVTSGPDSTSNGNVDGFVAKVNPAGSALLYAGYIGGAGIDAGSGIAVDGAGNAYITGSTYSDETTFPVVGGPDLTYNGDSRVGDAFVAKVNPAGSALLYAGYIGGAGGDGGWAIAVDAAGNAHVTGATDSDQASFPVVAGPGLTYNGGGDAFVAKVNSSGTALLYAGYIGGAQSDVGCDIAVDGTDYAYVTGYTYSDQATFPVAVGPDLTFNGGELDAFVAKVNPAGTVLLYAGYIGGAGGDAGRGIAVDGTGDAYVAGWTLSDETTFPVVGGPDLSFNGIEDAFVAKVGKGMQIAACKQDTAGTAIKDWLMTLSGPEPKSGQTLANGCITWAVTQPGAYTVTEEDRAGWTPQGATSAGFTVVSDGGPYSHTFVNRTPTLWLPLIMR